jgi:hypothetical protein
MGCRDLHFVDDEGLVGHDCFIAWGQKRPGEQAQDFIRSVPQNDLIRSHLPAIRQRFAQTKCAAIGIAMQGRGSPAQGGERLRGGA